tara:strand:- start:694 stop:1050 length:357 start_codon:yes stop_codon:yes gene_type:complete
MQTESYYTDEEAKQIVDTMRQQMGWNTLACIGAHMMSFGQWRGPGTVTLQIKTRNCAQRNRFVHITYDSGQDLYKVEAVNITGGKRNIVWHVHDVFFPELGDFVIEAADWTPTRERWK